MKTQFTKLLSAATFCMLLNASLGFKFVSLALERENLTDEEFSFSFMKDGFLTNLTGIEAYSLAPPLAPPRRNRLLVMKDVDISLILVVQQPGNVIPWHVHPRGSENYATISGKIQVSMTLEGLVGARRIVSKLPPGHATSIPQGLPHSVKCVSDEPCVYHIFFNSADAGFALTTI